MHAATTVTASAARSNLYRLIDSSVMHHQPIVITGKRNNAVLVSERDWAAVQETLYLLSIPNMRESIIEGMNTPTQDFATSLDWWFVMSWTLHFSKSALKDSVKIKEAGLKSKAEILLSVLQKNPFQTPPPYEKLVGDLSGAYSRRINIQHRLVYQVAETEKAVRILRMWTHYE